MFYSLGMRLDLPPYIVRDILFWIILENKNEKGMSAGQLKTKILRIYIYAGGMELIFMHCCKKAWG